MLTRMKKGQSQSKFGSNNWKKRNKKSRCSIKNKNNSWLNMIKMLKLQKSRLRTCWPQFLKPLILMLFWMSLRLRRCLMVKNCQPHLQKNTRVMMKVKEMDLSKNIQRKKKLKRWALLKEQVLSFKNKSTKKKVMIWTRYLIIPCHSCMLPSTLKRCRNQKNGSMSDI